MRVFRTTSGRRIRRVLWICFYVPNLGGSVVSDCGDKRPASGTLGYALGVGDTKQKFFCRPEGIMLGTQPVCEPLPLSAPNIDSESVVDVCIDRAEEGSCVVSEAHGFSFRGRPARMDFYDERFFD